MLTPPGPTSSPTTISTMPHDQLSAHDRQDAGDDEDNGEDPQKSCHGPGVPKAVLCGIGPFG